MKLSVFIYIDESSDANHYVLSAVGSHSPQTLNRIVKTFRSVVRQSRLSERDKNKINNDPKERHLYRNHPEMLAKYLELICNHPSEQHKPTRNHVHACTAVYKKHGIEMAIFPEERMLTVYIALFLEMIRAFYSFTNQENLEIIYDCFPKAGEVKNELHRFISQLYPCLTYTLDFEKNQEKGKHLGLYIADIVAGTSRRFVGKENPNYFHMIKKLLIEDIIKKTVH